MLIDGVNYAEELIHAIRNDELVVFVGAGVSAGFPTSLPNFTELVEIISKNTIFEFDEKKESHDVFLGRLEHSGINVKKRAAEYFINEKPIPNALHGYIINLFSDKSKIRLVTTNYEHTLEDSLADENVPIYDAPAFPLGNNFRGIVHLHGNQNSPENMILTDSDFGYAYLLEGYATRFLVKLFEQYTVLFIGYSYGDIVIRYLSRALPEKHKRRRFIVTDNGIENWDVLGLIPITYPEKKYDILYESIEKLGNRMNRNMIGWKNRCIEIANALPPLNQESIDEILEVFSNEIIVNFFFESLEQSKFYDWLIWLDKHKLLNFVYHDIDIDNKLKDVISHWIINKDINSNFINIFSLIAENNNKVSDYFIKKIFEQINYCNKKIEDVIIIKIIIRFQDKLHLIDSHILLGIAVQCNEKKLYEMIWIIYEALITPSFEIEALYQFVDSNLEYEGKYIFSTDAYILQEIYNKYLKNNMLIMLLCKVPKMMQ